MASDVAIPSQQPTGYVTLPSVLALVGFAAVLVASALARWAPDAILWRLVLLGLGLLAGGGAVALRPRSAVYFGVAALTCFLGVLSVKEWPTAHMAFVVVTLAAVVATLLYLPDLLYGSVQDNEAIKLLVRRLSYGVIGLAGLYVAWTILGEGFHEESIVKIIIAGCVVLQALLFIQPQVMRKVILSGLVIFHFGGILTAVTSVPPNPWIVNYIWTTVYRPYLQFMYLNNAYHFYSPDPGPPSLLWFHIEYDNGTARWVKVPNRAEHSKDPLAQEFYRRLSLTESTNQLLPPNTPIPTAVFQRREYGANIYGIPPHPEAEIALQYRVPLPTSQRMLKLYAQYAARAFPYDDRTVRGVPHEHLGDLAIAPNAGFPATLPWAALAASSTSKPVEVKRIKIYRVLHRMLEAVEFRNGGSPIDPTTFYPYYQGTFDKDGNPIYPYSDLQSPEMDPFLYWLIPIIREPVASSDPFRSTAVSPKAGNEGQVLDYLEKHAGTKHWEDGK